jgi:hypothetical protein
MRKFFLTAFVLAAAMVFATSGLALEKTAVQFDGAERADFWTQDYTCSVLYYNYCSGWIYYWGPWSPLDVFGVVFDPCCQAGEESRVAASWAYFWTGVSAPAGYGFTGTYGIYDAPADCPVTPALASQATLPVSGWNQYIFDQAVSGKFAVCYEAGINGANLATITTDHPASGCDLCYTCPRDTRSFYFGTFASPLCPGSPFFDDVENAEVWFDVQFNCVIGVEESSWGTIKGLYR